MDNINARINSAETINNVNAQDIPAERKEFMDNIKNAPELHCHVRSQYDAMQFADKLCDRLDELNMDGCAITDHGTVSSIEDYREVFDERGKKLVPGVELYVDGGILGRMHFLLLAADDEGWHCVQDIVTEANRNMSYGFPVISEGKLLAMCAEHKGHVFGSTACMQGVIAAIFRLNEKVEHELEKNAKHLAELGDVAADLANAKTVCDKAEQAVNDAIVRRDSLKAKAQTKFTTREKNVAKLIANGGPKAAELKAQLEADKAESAKAADELEGAQEAAKIAKKALSEANKAYKSVEEKFVRADAIETKNAELKSEMKSDEDLYKLASARAKKYAESFARGYFHMEVMNHGIPAEEKCMRQVVRLAHDLHLPLVATNDAHMTSDSDDDRLRRCLLRSMRPGNNKAFQEEQTGDSELYIKSDDERLTFLKKVMSETEAREALAEAQKIFDACDVKFEHGHHYPVAKQLNADGTYSTVSDAKHELLKLVQAGAKERFPEGMSQEYKDRANREFKVITDMDYANYHLVVRDYITYGRMLGYLPKEEIENAPLSIPELRAHIEKKGYRNPGYTIGTARGSAGGSLVCYLLGITNIDPMKYNLLFERFLNPERATMPDIDVDFAQQVREQCIKYVKHVYGNNAVCGIMTTNALAPKGAIAQAARFYGLRKDSRERTELGMKYQKMVTAEVGASFASKVNPATGKLSDEDDSIALFDYLMNSAKKDGEEAVEILKWARVLEGSFTSYGAHAAGIVIADNDDVGKYLALRYNSNYGGMTTQMDCQQTEDQGLLKFDFLGLKTCDIITDASKMIERNHGVILDMLKLDTADKAVYENVFDTARTNAVFQFGSNGMKAMLQRYKPDCFEDLVLLVAMFRPGPLQYLDDVISVKSGAKPVSYLCPELKPILGDTYGAIVYQEQVMQIFQNLAGYSLGGADLVRRYMAKKQSAKLEAERDAFVNGNVKRGIKGCVANGISAETANEIFDQMNAFSRYAFNRAHAAAYAYNAYITAYLEYHYPAEFFAAALNWAADTKEISALVREADSFGVKILPPDINRSGKEFDARDNAVLFGLGSVKGVSGNATAFVAEREKNGAFASLSDFCVRCLPNRAVAANLAAAGAFDAFGKDRKAMAAVMETLTAKAKDIAAKESFVKSANYVLESLEKYASDEELVKAQENAGLKAEIKKLTKADSLQKRIENAENALRTLREDADAAAMMADAEPESKSERMKAEKALLGMYVTAHPMDFYPEDKTATHTDEVSDGQRDVTLYGVITDLSIRKRKKDGANMAFFNLEDKNGSVACCAFADTYAEFGEKIAEDAVVKVLGDVHTNDSEDEELRFFVKSVATVSEMKPRALLTVENEDEFLKRKQSLQDFADPKGYELIIHVKNTGKLVKTGMKVGDAVVKLMRGAISLI